MTIPPGGAEKDVEDMLQSFRDSFAKSRGSSPAAAAPATRVDDASRGRRLQVERPQGWRVTGQDRRPAPAGTHRQAPGAFPVRAQGLRPAAAAQAGSPGGAREAQDGRPRRAHPRQVWRFQVGRAQVRR
jgi:hypothetical protein